MKKINHLFIKKITELFTKRKKSKIMEIKIEIEDVKSAYNKACGNTKSVLEGIFPFLRGTITERIKTFDDAVNELGETHMAVASYRAISGLTCIPHDILAYLKLRIIAAALNEGWEPSFSNDEYRYYPWFFLYTKDGLRNKSEEWKKEHAIRDCKGYGVLFGGDATYGASAGFVCAAADTAPSSAGASVGSRLCFKSEKLAIYAGKQFIDIWMDFNLIRK